MYNKNTQRHWSQFLAALMLTVLAGTLSAAVAPAGSFIGNQGSITFTDSEGSRRTVTSNIVQVEVLQVFAATLEADQTKPAASGGTVLFHHTLTNTGNGADSFSLSTLDLGGDFSFDGITIYEDNGSGQPGAEITAAIALAAGDSINIVIEGEIPATATDGQSGQIELTSVSDNEPTLSIVNTDTANVTDNAIVQVTKSVSPASGVPGDTGTFSLQIQNTSTTTAATSVSLTDTLEAAFSYTAETGDINATDADDASDGVDSDGVDYSFAANQVAISIANLAAGADITVTFDFTITAATEAGNATNVVDFSYDDGSGTQIPDSSNTVVYVVDPVAGVTGTGQNTPTASQGDTLLFSNVFTNAGNVDDTFNVLVDDVGSTFPAGTGFRLLQSDGATPLLDTNNDSIPDTGLLAPGVSYNVILEISLPADATGDNGGAGFAVDKTATSVVDPNVSVTVTDSLGGVDPATVDLTETLSVNGGADASNGLGTGPEGAFVIDATVNAGASATFPLFVNNTGSGADNYILSEPTLPAGWVVTYFLDGGNGDCSSLGAQNTTGTTGNLASGSNLLFCSVVSVPAGQSAGDYQVNFAVESASTGARDELRSQVTVSGDESVVMTPPSLEGTTVPAGTVVYSHTVTNDGNIDTEAFFNNSNTEAGWTTTIYIDTNGNGILDDGDVALPQGQGIDIAVGADVDILIEVTAAPGSDIGDQNITTVTTHLGSPTAAVAASVIDTTTISTGDISLAKTQAVDTDCNGLADGAFTDTVVQAEPGQCVVYRLAASNTGSITVTNAETNDPLPQYTAYTTCGGSCAASADQGGTVTSTLNDGDTAGTVTAEWASIGPSQTVTLQFVVRLTTQ
jgi:uncharacterized repeat protein (TIGR01451 family)